MACRAVLFDLDGTLLNTLQDLADSVNNILARSGFPTHRVQDYKYFVGSGMRNTVTQALPENHRDQETVDILYAQMEDEYSRNWSKHTHPYPGIPKLLDTLANKDIKSAILSNKPQKSAEQMVYSLLSRWHFEVVAGAQPALPLKPDPMAALQIANSMNISPQAFVYLGDSAIDMKTATAAKMYPVGVLWGFRTAEELLAAGAKELIEQPCELVPIIQDW
jgi:phosphoglycolate phosphatase